MICEKCNHHNPANSKFCEECGSKLVNTAKKVKVIHHTSSVAEELDDVIFTPKREDHSLRNFILIFFGALLLIFISLIVLRRSSTTAGTADTTGNGNNGSNFNIACLELDKGTMMGNSYYIPNPTYKSSIHSSCDRAVKDVILRVNFYRYGATSRAETPLDTEYVDVASYLGPGDSFTIDQVIKTNADTSGGFSWTADVYTATPL